MSVFGCNEDTAESQFIVLTEPGAPQVSACVSLPLSPSTPELFRLLCACTSGQTEHCIDSKMAKTRLACLLTLLTTHYDRRKVSTLSSGFYTGVKAERGEKETPAPLSSSEVTVSGGN
ncbi:hypothetical protein D9C73_017851 [Collichthys lucidus]|uniref:Uncharacterized protein n=1 Tax=Collichthys lucidus TaxID=240159 RepID=A0A4U5V7Q8_COLLU|nr:hypothetical protein D9C73_017830 [Collichthys lucidus]TKS83738.1 hypothetical protein D9C73_017851 [Collichthys lucidus]